MFSLDDILMKEFTSISDAAKYIIERDNKENAKVKEVEAHIIDVCKNRRKTAYKQKWEYNCA